MLALFSSNHIDESTKWRTALLLMTRYWSVSTALFTAVMVILGNVHKLAYGTDLYSSAPLIFLGQYNTGLFIATVLGELLLLFRQGEPWYRWVQAMVFLPIAATYLLFQVSMILWSWVHFSCYRMEWVPTARAVGDEQHAIKMDNKAHATKRMA